MALDFRRFAVNFSIKTICGFGEMFNCKLLILPARYRGEMIGTQLVFILCLLFKKNIAK